MKKFACLLTLVGLLAAGSSVYAESNPRVAHWTNICQTKSTTAPCAANDIVISYAAEHKSAC
jgi:hypothetical protein